MKFAMITVCIMLVCSCVVAKSHLVSKADFEKITAGMFDPAKYDKRGSGTSAGGDEQEFSVTYEPKDKTAALHFDFAAWEAFLTSRDNFNGKGKGGSQGLYWRQTWRNNARYIVIEAVAMKNDNIRVVYREILR